jgi:hypothetical protein
MAILLVTYDLKAPGRNYGPVFDYLKQFTYCKGLESVWLLDTTTSVGDVRTALQGRVDGNDKILVARLTREWASYNFGCADWLNDSSRRW